ncbi:sulfotransferase 1B1-like isoform X2 [Saccostrea echinata]|uniref:sulfotransferase 1B1-like isoform X2 n=1 Tax=Saccostrea echinata TaxID=191078 RepID=UPI002A827083|nr:sulfotransferase 1B1-like isoform X2 [Saccostrea echinata]
MANQNPEKPPKKYDIASFEGEEIIERKCPSGYTARYIKLHEHWKPLEFIETGFAPDPRTHVPELRKMEVFDDDVFIYAYPKCGTHWIWEMIFMLHKGKGRFDFFDYVKEWENEIKKKKRNYLCLYYEEMKKDPLTTLKSLAEYLGIPCSDTLAEEIVHKCKIENLRIANREKFDHRNQSGPNPEMNDPDKMYRKGEVGDWKNWFTVAQSEEFDRVFRKKMADSDFQFAFE